MTLLYVALIVIGALFAVSVASLAGRLMRPVVYPMCTVFCVALLALNATLFLSGQSEAVVLPFGLPGVGVHLRLDALSAFFGVIVNLSGALISLYGVGYGRSEENPMRILPFYPAFLAGMNLVIIADDAFTFLVAWEFMSLSSWALVVSHHREALNREAGYIYLLMANFGTIALLFAFGVLAGPDGGYAFDTMRTLDRPVWATVVALAMTLAGAGSKAGLVPLHVWLPLAHPAAPSHVSALMSGVMTKVAIYGIVRIVFELCGELQWWWSMPMLLLGGATAVLGILYALMQRDIKKLLAYSTVENIGVVVVGLGLAIAFRASDMQAAAAVAMTAALLHVFNHALFKSLLFLGTGNILLATGLRDIERMGGLIHRMPVTAVLFLVGFAAAAALPPLNGFVSEWMLFQAVLASPDLPQPGLRFLVPAVGVALALSTALAASCFVKLYGIAFLGRARSPEAMAAHETGRFSLAAMAVFAGLCVINGLFAAPIVETMAPLTLKLVGGALPDQRDGAALFSLTPFATVRSSYNALILLAFILISSGLTVLCIHELASRRQRRGAAWDCGYPDASPVTQYTASSFAQPLRRIFGSVVFRAREEVEMPPPGETRPAILRVCLADPVWDIAYAPAAKGVLFLADRMNVLQFLTIRSYLMLMFSALIILLIVVAL